MYVERNSSRGLSWAPAYTHAGTGGMRGKLERLEQQQMRCRCVSDPFRLNMHVPFCLLPLFMGRIEESNVT